MMKNIVFKSLAVLMMVGALTIVSFAQSNNKRIQFAKDKNSAVEKFTLPANDGITYILGVRQWNLLKFTVTGLYADKADAQGLTITLTKLGSDKVLAEASPGEEIEHQFADSGDYVITVMNPGTRRANISLNVSINAESEANSDVCEGCDNPNTNSEAERIQLSKGQTDADLDLQLEGKETRSYVAYVLKGYMTCIMPQTNLGSGVTIKVNGNVLNPNNGPCTARSTTAGDQIIEFINNGNREKNFTVSVGFHQKN